MTPPIRDRSDLFWGVWLGTVVGSFAALEAVAYRTSRPATLSRSLRRWFGIHPRSRRHYFSAVGLIGGCVALLVHLETLPPLPSGDDFVYRSRGDESSNHFGDDASG